MPHDITPSDRKGFFILAHSLQGQVDEKETHREKAYDVELFPM